MEIGSGYVLAERLGAKEFVDPCPYTVGGLTETFKKYTGIGNVLPVMEYGEQQLKELYEMEQAAYSSYFFNPCFLINVSKTLSKFGSPTSSNS